MELVLTPAAARAQLRVGSAVTDQHLLDLVAAAQGLVCDQLGRRFLVDPVGGWPSVDEVPAGIRHAVKLVVVDLYENRCTPLAELTGVRLLLERHMKLSFG